MGLEFTLVYRFTAQFDLANAEHDAVELGQLPYAVGRKFFLEHLLIRCSPLP